MRERAIWAALQSENIAAAMVTVMTRVAPPEGVTNAAAWLVAVAATPDGATEKARTLRHLAQALAIPARPLRGLDTVKTLAEATAASDWYTVARLVARLRGAAPATGRRHLYDVLDALMRWDALDVDTKGEITEGPLTELCNP